MSELLLMYWPAILAATLTAGALGLMGAFLVTRRVGVQTLAVSQGASFGLLAGLVVVSFGVHDDHLEHTLWPLLLGFLGAGAASFISGRGARRAAEKGAWFVACFALLLAFTQLLTGLFPVVATSANSLYFGDVVTIDFREAALFVGCSGAALAYLARNWRFLSDRSFLLSLQEEAPFAFGPDLTFSLLSLGLLCLSIQLLGLLFTLGSLFLPTVILARDPRPGVGRHLLRAGVSGAVAAGGGFTLSLLFPELRTTPTMVAAQCLLPLLLLSLTRLGAFSKTPETP